VAIALFMGAVDLTIVATALPAIHRSLRASINWAGWTITIYGLGSVVALPVAGKLSDQFGRRRVFLSGVALFTVSSFLCGVAPDVYMLIVFRALQAIGGGALQPSAAGLVAEHFGNGRDRAIGMFAAIQAGGQVVGPVLGGLLVGYWSWRWIFFVNVPIGIVLLGLTIKFIPESRVRIRAKTDVRGLLLLSSFVFAGIFGITSLGGHGTAIYDPTFLVPECAAVGLLYLLLRHTNRSAAPFIPMRLLRGKGFAAMNALNLLQGSVTFGVASLVPLYAEQRYHLPALSAGTLLTSRAIGSVTIGVLAALALRRTGYRRPIIVGFWVVGIGTLLMSVAPRWGLTPFVWLSICTGIIGLGLGAINPAASNAGLRLAAEDEVAAIAGLRFMFLNLGVIFAVSITTAILNRSGTPGITQAHIFWVVAGLIALLVYPLARRVPEHKGTW
jgi:EmrB/QacA subfamily drug resistance transporter